MTTFTVGYFVGSLSSKSLNRQLARALALVAPRELEMHEIAYGHLPLFNRDLEGLFPAEATALKDAIKRHDAVLFVTPEYNRSIPGALKNAIDWASRPRGDNAFTGKPSAVTGASTGALGTAIAQQHLRTMLAYCQSPQLSGEAYIQVTPGLITPEGEITKESTRNFLTEWMHRFAELIDRHHSAEYARR